MQNENTFRKTRPDDVLGNLPPEKKNMIVRWLGEMSYEDVLKRIAELEPRGLGIETHYNSLRRFYTKNLPEDLVSFRREEMTRLRGFAEVCEAEPAPYDALIREFFTKGVFYQSLGLPHHDERFRENMRLLLDLRAQELRKKHLELQRERLENAQNKPKSDVTLQIFAGFQAQIEQMITKSLSQAGPKPSLEHKDQPLQILESNPAEAPVGGANPEEPAIPEAVAGTDKDTEKHDSTPNNTI